MEQYGRPINKIQTNLGVGMDERARDVAPRDKLHAQLKVRGRESASCIEDYKYIDDKISLYKKLI